ncbi:MAG: alkaline ceramidase [Lachnospiraceae bacterium]|nr:alkaline ceramidase [Lachnospiraceae bacterium]
MLKLGLAEVDITPDRPMELVGFYREDNRSKGVLKPLMAQVAVWKNEERCCLITIDSIGFTKELSDKLRIKVGGVLGVTKEKVMLCFSHTHAAPDADMEREYYDEICVKIEDAVLRALNDLTPVNVGWKNATAHIGVNRRPVTKDTDDRVGILIVCDADKKGETTPKLIILRVTTHGNVLKADNTMISPDYFGDTREVIGRKYHCPVMMIQGSAGSTAPRYFCSGNTPVDARMEECVRSKTGLADMANTIADSVTKVIDDIELHHDCDIRMFSKYIELTADVPTVEEAIKVAKEAKELCGIIDTGWMEKVAALNTAGVHEQSEDVEMQYLSIGDWCLCGGPYEFMVGFALETERILGNEFFYFNGYTNGCLLYFPTEDEFDAGGYEVFWSMLIYYKYIDRVYPFRRDAASKLIKFVTEKMYADL